MDTQDTTTTSSETKQITIEVPAERLAEFYAFLGHFLAGGGPGRRRHGGPRGHRGHHRCGSHRGEHETEAETAEAASA